MDQKPVTRVLANVTTFDTTIVGEIVLPQAEIPGSSYHFRLVELLNNPRLGLSLTGQLEETLAVDGAKVIPAQGEVVPIAGRLHIRLEQIVHVFEYDSNRERTRVQCDPMRFRGAEMLSIIASGGTRIEGTFLGGSAVLASVAGKRFVAVSQATLQDLRHPDQRLQTPFIIVNRTAIVGFSALSGG